MNKKKIALASLSSALLSLMVGVELVQAQANVDSVLPDGNQASADSVNLTFSNTTGNETQTAVVNVTGATQQSVNVAAAAINNQIGNGSISTTRAIATLLTGASGTPLSVNSPLAPGAILRVISGGVVTRQTSPDTPRAIISFIASNFVQGTTQGFQLVLADGKTITVTITSVPQGGGNANRGVNFPNLALDPNANANLIAANLIAQSNDIAEGVIETNDPATKQITKLIVSGTEPQMKGGLSAGVAAGAAGIAPSGQQIAAELGTIAPSVDPGLMVQLTSDLQGLLASVNASLPTSDVLVASADLTIGLQGMNRTLVAQGGGAVDVQKLSNTINTYNQIVQTATDEDVTILAANDSFAGLGGILKQLSAAVKATPSPDKAAN